MTKRQAYMKKYLKRYRLDHRDRSAECLRRRLGLYRVMILGVRVNWDYLKGQR